MSSAPNALAPKIWRGHIPVGLAATRRVPLADRPTKTATRTALREAQRRYLDTVLRLTRRTLSDIAREGGLNHTTLTRFYNRPSDDRLLETMTINIIAKVTGIAPPAELLAGPIGGLAEQAEPYEAAPNDPLSRAVQALLRGRTSADPWVLRTRALEDAGLLPGDIVILDQAVQPVSGDVVCAQVYDRSGAETVWRIYQPPYLVAASRDPAYRRPLYVDGQHVLIRGVVTDQLRRRQAAA